jgi:hypothetical protein
MAEEADDLYSIGVAAPEAWTRSPLSGRRFADNRGIRLVQRL